MSVTPPTLTRVGGYTSSNGQWGNNNELKYFSTVSNKIYYAAWRTDGNGFWWSDVSGGVPRTSIYLDTDDGKWYDHDGLNPDGSEHDPVTVTAASSQTVGSGNITLYNASGATKFVFVNPTEAQASWLPLSSTGTEGGGGTTPAGTITESGGTMIFKVLSSSPSSAVGYITYELYKDGVLTTVDFSSHTIGTTTTRTSNVLQSSWLLKMVSSTGLFETQTLATFNSGTKRKVFGNFW